MKKLITAILALFFCNVFNSMYAQHPMPDKWEAFVNNSAYNVAIRDTFLFQSFEQSKNDNWNYYGEKCIRFDAAVEGITGQDGKFSLKIPTGEKVSFTPLNIAGYSQVQIYFRLGAKNLNKGDQFYFLAPRESNKDPNKTLTAVAKENLYSFGYMDSFYDGTKLKRNKIIIGQNPIGLSFINPEENGNGFFCIDSLFASGSIAQYSLFLGEGNWNDTILWSHIPAARNRTALIKGDIVVDSDINCKTVFIDKGTLKVDQNGCLIAENLYITDKTTFENSGIISVSNETTFYKTFSEKGKWYFLTFPFDVYIDGIEDFELKDNTPNNGGNYLYALAYNGIRRSNKGSGIENWDILNPNSTGNKPLFEKGKGYLIAIDEKASKNIVGFKSRKNLTNSNLSNSGIISIDLTEHSNNISSPDYGWILCGNPLLTPILSGQIQPASLLDGNIYVFNGEEYECHPLKENVIIPPFTTFFLKGRFSGQLEISRPSTLSQGTKIASQEMFFIFKEPNHENISIPVSNEKATAVNIQCYVRGQQLYLSGIPEQGYGYIYDMNGKLVKTISVTPGSISFSLDVSPGIYILHLGAGSYQNQYKFVITQ